MWSAQSNNDQSDPPQRYLAAAGYRVPKTDGWVRILQLQAYQGVNSRPPNGITAWFRNIEVATTGDSRAKMSAQYRSVLPMGRCWPKATRPSYSTATRSQLMFNDCVRGSGIAAGLSQPITKRCRPTTRLHLRTGDGDWGNSKSLLVLNKLGS